MVLEATVICIDNSEYSRNGDYIPSRLDVQFDAANIICGAKANSNPENAVGLLTSAGDRVIVRVTPTQDIGKILQGSHDIFPEGETDVIHAVQTAQLALKHRMNKNQKQRIVLFVGSPLKATERQLEKLGRVLKKNNIALDIISLGETSINSEKLSKLYNTVNSNGTSHFLECPVESTRVLSDVLMMSPIIRDGDPRALNTLPTRLVGLEGQENSVNVDVGVDPRLDPELYMALQISLLEERERQSRNADTDREGNSLQEGREAYQANAETPVNQIQSMEGIDDDLRQALLLSLEDFYHPRVSNDEMNATVPDPT